MYTICHLHVHNYIKRMTVLHIFKFMWSCETSLIYTRTFSIITKHKYPQLFEAVCFRLQVETLIKQQLTELNQQAIMNKMWETANMYLK